METDEHPAEVVSPTARRGRVGQVSTIGVLTGNRTPETTVGVSRTHPNLGKEYTEGERGMWVRKGSGGTPGDLTEEVGDSGGVLEVVSGPGAPTEGVTRRLEIRNGRR